MIAQRIEIRLDPKAASPEDFSTFFDAVAEALYDCEGVFDQDLSGDAEDGSLTFRMAVPTADAADAIVTALTAVRTALHSVGASTPGWEKHMQVLLNSVDKGAETGELLTA